MAELIAEDGDHRKHRQRLRELLDATKGPVRITSPYVTDDDLLCGTGARSVRLLTSLEPESIMVGATKLHVLRSLLQAGTEVRGFSDGGRLHAKVYIFADKCGVVTSANLTTRAFESNIEVGVQLTGRIVNQLIAWFDTLWRRAKHSQIRLSDLVRWEHETEALRRAYAALRKRVATKPKLPAEAIPYVRSQAGLRQLLDEAPGFFVCNTNRRWSSEAEELMRRERCAAVWEDFNWPSHMQRVEPGAAIFMFRKGAGIIGVGRAKAGHEVIGTRDPRRIRRPEEYDAPEWRVPVEDWLVWVEDSAEACPCSMPNASFVDVR